MSAANLCNCALTCIWPSADRIAACRRVNPLSGPMSGAAASRNREAASRPPSNRNARREISSRRWHRRECAGASRHWRPWAIGMPRRAGGVEKPGGLATVTDMKYSPRTVLMVANRRCHLRSHLQETPPCHTKMQIRFENWCRWDKSCGKKRTAAYPSGFSFVREAVWSLSCQGARYLRQYAACRANSPIRHLIRARSQSTKFPVSRCLRRGLNFSGLRPTWLSLRRLRREYRPPCAASHPQAA